MDARSDPDRYRSAEIDVMSPAGQVCGNSIGNDGRVLAGFPVDGERDNPGEEQPRDTRCSFVSFRTSYPFNV
jgi:hypothetical protein